MHNGRVDFLDLNVMNFDESISLSKSVDWNAWS
jgi:hypothetical protein